MKHWILRRQDNIIVAPTEAYAEETLATAAKDGIGDIEVFVVEHPLSPRDVASLFAGQEEPGPAVDRFARTGRVELDTTTGLVEIEGQVYAIPPRSEATMRTHAHGNKVHTHVSLSSHGTEVGKRVSR